MYVKILKGTCPLQKVATLPESWKPFQVRLLDVLRLFEGVLSRPDDFLEDLMKLRAQGVAKERLINLFHLFSQSFYYVRHISDIYQILIDLNRCKECHCVGSLQEKIFRLEPLIED